MKSKSNNPHTPSVLGVIPARGGSKRLPRKNIKSLLGKPLIAYTIEAAQKADCLTDFVVSSEDEEILSVARKYGGPTPFVRPESLSGDEVRNIDTVMHAMNFMEKRAGKNYDILVLLQPTCPIRDASHINKAVTELWASDQHSAVSVKGPYKKRDPILKRINDDVLEPYCKGSTLEDNHPFYLYNASIYAVKRDYFVKEKKLISHSQVPVIMDAFHSVEYPTSGRLIQVRLRGYARRRDQPAKNQHQCVGG